jgi:predicted TIM-barrel fold metal-dependent hydrolase
MHGSNWLARVSRVAAIALAAQIVLGAAPQGGRMAASSTPVPALSPFIDAHTHFDERHPDAAVDAAIAALTRQNAEAIFFQSPPDSARTGAVEAETIEPPARAHPTKLAVLGGGGTLNAIIQRSAASADVAADVVRTFRERAEQLLAGGAIGFGEMTAEHFAGGTPYQHAPPDHPLFLLLADIAAQHDVPIDLHIEAVPAPMPLPIGLTSPPNAAQLQENILAFERLLRHNRRARIIWAHAGSDGTGHRTPALARRLLQAHPNLFMELKTDPVNPGRTYPIGADGRIKPEWRALLSDFPDRFIVGSDQHYPEPENQPQRWQQVVLLLNQLPAALRHQIGTANVRRIFPRAPLKPS